ncbi:MAG: MucB/RseB C-terminal domain-containing protein [Hahellaceae bacterium]|jgi:sigma-E factor negative regulatory protein RseB|nr:MucB/RseB C-terminal domain-containing protein [Hahellaceae bacterium]
MTRWVGGLCLVLCWSGLLRAETPIRADEILSRLRTSLAMLDYAGTLTYLRDDDATSLRIEHRLLEGLEQERVVSLEGGAKESLRWGGQVIRSGVGGDKDVLSFMSGKNGASADAFSGDRVNRVYMVHLLGVASVAGRETEHYHLMSVDGYRYSQMVWLDAVSGLPLKSVVLNAEGHMLESVQFNTITLNPDFPADFAVAFGVFPAPAGEVQSPNQPPPHQRWTPGWVPDAFVPVTAQFSPDASSAGEMQSFSDGFSRFTVFVEPPGPAQMPEGSSRRGATIALTRHRLMAGARVAVTVLGEIPLATASRVADNMRQVSEGRP